ncbi:MAG: hypothetical protein ABH885_04970 [Candidatus Omnitrophota bacterium]
MYKTIFLGTIVRSGGSLLARLFDGHPEILSYPVEVGFPFANGFYPIFESYVGVPSKIPDLDGIPDADVYSLMGIPKAKPKVALKWGKEHADPVGARKNYLEKVYYDTVKTDFDFDRFIQLFDEYRKGARTVAGLYDARHRAYFEAWDKGRHIGEPKFVLLHDSGGLYLADVARLFKEFEGSVFILPIRDVMGYIASEKTRLARRYYGARRFSYPPFPNFLVRAFTEYDLDAHIRGWMVAFTRAVLFQEKYGVNGRFIAYGHSNLINDTEGTMRALLRSVGARYDGVVLEPTIGGHMWTGNSHQGKRKGVSKDLESYYPKVLSAEETDKIREKAGALIDFLKCSRETPLDLTKIPKKHLPDYEYQRKYFDDEEKAALYYALMNTGCRRAMVRVPPAYSVLAFLYSKMVQLIHMPRMLKMKYFPGLGKQNYT